MALNKSLDKSYNGRQKTVYFETLGCPKNTYDSAHAAGILENCGFTAVDSPEDADVIIVNTCGFIEDAKRESIATILELAEYKAAGKFLVVSGCLSQRYGAELTGELPEIDAAIGVGEYDRLPDVLDDLFERVGLPEGLHNKSDMSPVDAGRSAVTLLNERSLSNDALLSQEYKQRRSVYLKIADGCDNCCSYCVIPGIRGPYLSRPIGELLREADEMSKGGVAEIILVAQDVTAYGVDLYGKSRLTDLVRGLCAMQGIKWIRLMYCYEDRVTDELIRLIAEEEKVCNYIDLPLQHISDRILRAMGRRSTKSSIISTIARLRASIPDICIRTTFITGFPGETEQEYAEMMGFISEYKFNRLGVFAYSKEEDTPAASFKDQVRKDVKAGRLDGLMRLQQGISLKSNQAMIGRVLVTLVEEVNEDGSFTGRTMYDAPEIDNGVIFSRGGYEAEVGTGDFVRVLITDAFDYDLVGEIAGVGLSRGDLV